jgi:hypothetical protein
MTCQFVTRAVRTAHRSRPTNRCCDGGFDEDDVLVALSLPVEVVAARRAALSRCEDAQDPATQPRPAAAVAWRRLDSEPLFPICNPAASNLTKLVPRQERLMKRNDDLGSFVSFWYSAENVPAEDTLRAQEEAGRPSAAQ